MKPGRGESGLDPEERNRILESVLESIGVPFLIGGRDGRLLFFSERAGSLFGLTLSDVGRPLRETVTVLQDPAEYQHVEQVIESGVQQRIEVNTGVETYEQRMVPLETPEGAAAGVVITYSPMPG